MLGPSWAKCSMIFLDLVLDWIFANASQKNVKTQKIKSGSRYVKYDVSWRSLGWKKNAQLSTNASFFPSIFHPKIDQKSIKKSRNRRSPHKSTKPRSLWLPFWHKINLGLIFGIQRGPKNGPTGVSISDPDHPWSLSEVILGVWTPFSQFWLHFGAILDPSWAHFGSIGGLLFVFFESSWLLCVLIFFFTF